MNGSLFRRLLMADPSPVSWEVLARSLEPGNDCELVAVSLTLLPLNARLRFRAFAVLTIRYPLFDSRQRFLVRRALRDPHPAVRKLGVAWLLMQRFRGDEWARRELRKFAGQSFTNFCMALAESVRIGLHVVKLALRGERFLSQN